MLSGLPQALLLTIIPQIAIHLLAACNGDMTAARNGAKQIIDAYAPQNDIELRLVAQIIAFGLQSGEALAQAAANKLSLNQVLRPRSGAVSLDRQMHKAEQQLAKLRKASAGAQPKAPKAQAETPHATRPQATHPQATHLQATHLQPTTQQPTFPPAHPEPAPLPLQQAAAPIETPRTIAAYAKAKGLSWTQGMKQRNRDMRLAQRDAKDAAKAAATRPAPAFA